MERETRRLTLAVEGMSCTRCLNTVRAALDGVPGARVESVRMGMATVDFDPAATSAQAITSALGAEGYRAWVVD